MLTSKLIGARTRVGAGLLLGLIGQAALTAEEVVVYGNDVVERTAEAEARVQADLREYLETFNRELKARRREELKNFRAPEVKLAISEVRTRG